MHITKGFFKVPANIVEGQYHPKISASGKVLYMTLCYCLNKFTDGKDPEKDFFFCTSEDLIKLSGLSHNTLDKARKELQEFGLIECWLESVPTKDKEKKTTWHKCHYRILE